MKKQLRLSHEATMILRGLDTPQLHFLNSLRQDKDFSTFSEIINLLIDTEKNMFFGEDESKYSEGVWQARHAYARGGIAKLIMLTQIIIGSEIELNYREGERKKRQQEKDKTDG